MGCMHSYRGIYVYRNLSINFPCYLQNGMGKLVTIHPWLICTKWLSIFTWLVYYHVSFFTINLEKV